MESSIRHIADLIPEAVLQLSGRPFYAAVAAPEPSADGRPEEKPPLAQAARRPRAARTGTPAPAPLL